MRLLLQRPDTDVNLATYYGTTALTFAIRSGNVAAVGPQLLAITDRLAEVRCPSSIPPLVLPCTQSRNTKELILTVSPYIINCVECQRIQALSRTPEQK